MDENYKSIREKLREVLLNEDALNELKQSSYSYGCVMLYYKVDSSWWKKIQNLIEDEDVDRVDGVLGREKYKDVHVTLLYGLHKNIDEDKLEEILSELTVKQLEPKKISHFKGKTNEPVKFDVHGSFLDVANRKLKGLPHTSEFPNYVPHLTIAYVKKGKGEDYDQTLPSNLHKIIKPSHFIYSRANGTEKRFEIKK